MTHGRWTSLCTGVLAVLLSLVVLGCAQKGNPEGGPPDTTAPQVVHTVPGSSAVNVDPTTPLEIEFTEAVTKAQLLPNLYVSPKRAGTPDVKWSGRTARILWADTLRDDVTYRVTVGSRLTDVHNNPLAEPYTFAFSTGDQIDSGRVTGRVWQDMTPAAAYDVFAFMLTAKPWDPASPDYQTQTNDSGRFDLPYLPNAVYRLLAVQDKNKNAKPDHGEFVAVAPNDVQSTRDTHGAGIELYATLYDTLPFVISGCTVSDDGSILIGFSHALDTARWTTMGFAVSDSATGARIDVGILDPIPPRFTIVPAIPEDAAEGRVYRVAYAPSESGGGQIPHNTLGALLAPCTSYVKYRTISDTTGPRISWTRFPTATTVLSPSAPIAWGFSEPIAIEGVEDAVGVFDSTGSSIEGVAELVDARHLIFTPNANWPDTTTVVVTLDSASIQDLHGNPAPTQTFNWTFPPLNQSGMGDVVLRVQTADSALAGAPIVVMTRSARTELARRWTLLGADTLTVSLPAGEWLFGAFWDVDANGQFDPGSVSPQYRPAEPRATLLDTVPVRARFTVEDITLGL